MLKVGEERQTITVQPKGLMTHDKYGAMKGQRGESMTGWTLAMKILRSGLGIPLGIKSEALANGLDEDWGEKQETKNDS